MPPPSYQSNPEIPPKAYRPLLEIAQQGYDASDIKQWYLTITRHLRRIGSENVEAAYHLLTPTSECPPTLQDQQVQIFGEDHQSSLKPTATSRHSDQTPKLDTSNWSSCFSFDPFAETRLNVFSTPPAQPTYEPALDSGPNVQMSAQWSPSATAAPEIDVNELSTVASTAAEETQATIAGAVASSPQWFSPDTFDVANDIPRSEQSYCGYQYQLAMSNTSMPLLVPYESPIQMSYTLASSITANTFSNSSRSATELYYSPYAPPISIIPSRKRRKILKKGVKKMMQPLQQQRNSF